MQYMSDIVRKHQKSGTENARELRKNMTPQEVKLWYRYLKDYPIRILRQKVIGGYIVDFYCRQGNLAIEIDGNQHYTKEGLEYDFERCKLLEAYGVDKSAPESTLLKGATPRNSLGGISTKRCYIPSLARTYSVNLPTQNSEEPIFAP